MTPNIYNNSATAFNTATNTLAATAAPGAIGKSMNRYFNSYINDVLGNALARNRDEMNQSLNGIKSQAAQAGAYGGARQGLVEAQTIDNYGRNADELTASLLSQGYDKSVATAIQELGLQQNAGATLGNLGNTMYNVGSQATQQQNVAGSQQQQLLQSILSGASSQYDAAQKAPLDTLTQLISAVSGGQVLAGNSSTAQTQNPGLFQWAGMGMNTYAAGK